MEGEHILLSCSVYSMLGPLSVLWQWTDKDGSGPAVDVVAVDRDGTVRPGPTYQERHSYGEVHAERVRADTFTLALHNAYPSDNGQYHCSATEWLQSGSAPDWTWQEIGKKAATKTVTVKSVGKTNQASLTWAAASYVITFNSVIVL